MVILLILRGGKMSVDSATKLIEYVNRVSKVRIIVDGSVFGHLPPTRVTIKKSFYLEDSCVMCGRCCVNEASVWTSEGYARLMSSTQKTFTDYGLAEDTRNSLLTGLHREVHIINNKLVPFWVFPKDDKKIANRLSWPDRKETTRCHWLFERDGTHRCGIHPVRSVTCGLPHIKFISSEKTRHTTMGVSPYGRNFRLKCPVQFTTISEEGMELKLLWLRRLNNCAEDMGIETFLPEILSYLEKGGRDEVVFTAGHKKLF